LVKDDDDVCEGFVSLRCKVKNENLFEQKKFLPLPVKHVGRFAVPTNQQTNK
jgi:hypothetical protein